MRPMAPTRTCPRCKRDLPRDAFDPKRKANGAPQGLQPRCRECREQLAARCWGQPVQEHFWRFVVPAAGCWEWTGARDPDGYGHFANRHKHYRAHRLSYEIHHGPIPPGMWVCHRCDNPPCVNPEHLFLDSNAGNTADRHTKGRSKGVGPGEAHPMAKLGEAEVREIRRRRADGETLRTLAAAFGVVDATILRIVRRENWKHVV